MSIRFLVVVLAMLGLGASSVPSQTHSHSDSHEKGAPCSMFPKNDLYYPENTGSRAMNFALFTQMLDHLENVYRPIFQKTGHRFRIERRWFDGEVNAYATSDGFTRNIHMFGGLARHPQMTADGFLLVACHEIGHHLGGAPLKFPSEKTFNWASSEGASDYYGTLKCMRKVLRGLDNESVVSRMTDDRVANRYCNDVFHSREEVAVCLRSMAAGQVLAKVLADLSNDKAPSYATPDLKISPRTYVNHPAAQCRFDTYMAGSLCDVSDRIALSAKNVEVGSCDDFRNRRFGRRPFCWYNPNDPKVLPVQ